MLKPVDCTLDELAIRITPMVDVLLQIGTLGHLISREEARQYVVRTGTTTLDTKEAMLLQMLEMSVDTRVQYIDAREERVFLCNTVFGGAACMMDCGRYRVFLRDDDKTLTRCLPEAPAPQRSLSP